MEVEKSTQKTILYCLRIDTNGIFLRKIITIPSSMKVVQAPVKGKEVFRLHSREPIPCHITVISNSLTVFMFVRIEPRKKNNLIRTGVIDNIPAFEARRFLV